MAVIDSSPKTQSKAMKLFNEAVAISFWIYIVSKVGIFDLDVYVINRFFPSLKYILDYKLFIFLAIISLLWLIIGKKQFPKFAGYILIYPIIIISWKIPKLIFKNWSAAIVFSPAIFEVATTFRTIFISYTIVTLAAICVLITTNRISLVLSMFILFTLLILHLYSSFKKAYKSTVFSKLSNFISSIKEQLDDSSNIQKMLDGAVSNKTENNEQKNYHTKLTTLYAFHWGIEFASDKIRDVARSRKMDLYLILSWFWTVIFTSLIFSFEYFALYKINPSSFIITFKPNYFSFLGLSFGKLTPSSVSTILPNDLLATILCYVELACSILIVVILVFTILTAARERYKEDIEKILTGMNDIATILQNNLQQMFNLALADVEHILVNNNNDLVNSLRKLRGLPEIAVQTENSSPKASVENETEIIQN